VKSSGDAPGQVENRFAKKVEKKKKNKPMETDGLIQLRNNQKTVVGLPVKFGGDEK